MQSMPTLLRQSLRSSIHLTKGTSRPVQVQFHAGPPSAFSARPTTRSFSVCLQCQFRRPLGLYSSHDKNDKVKFSNDAERLTQAVKEAPNVTALPEDAGAARDSNATAEADGNGGCSQGQLGESKPGGQPGTEQNGDTAISQSGGLPSSLESRRSKMSKQFTSMMDTIQSNVFVAGQRLNDLTGYSGIEALKNEIHSQEARLQAARAQVRKAKDEYAAAINRRSTSQREVNELLQRKHAWSPTDLERFTLLYRNDHTNEVAETETQEALSRAESEAEEAAAVLSKSILSRYHEEQVWSDKIRRMSTWGTWGLMGVNVLLFLIFQIAIEPWRRRRLVKGFEDKVVEALEKEKGLHRGALSEDTVPSGVIASVVPEVIDSTPETEELRLNSAPASTEAGFSAVDGGISSSASKTIHSETLFSRISNISSSPISLEYWRQLAQELFSERSIAFSQRDLTVSAMQSAAVGATVMGLILALVRS